MSRRRSGPELTDADAAVIDDLLAMMLVLPTGAPAVLNAGLEPGDFGLGWHAVIAGMILDTVRVGDPIDPGAIAADLKEAGGDVARLHGLIASTPSSGLLPKRIDQVRAIAERSGVALAAAAYYENGDAHQLLADIATTVGRRRRDNHGFVAASTVRTKAIWWAWDDRIPLGELTLLVGFEKTGKSLLCCDLAARLSRGQLAGHRYGEPVTSLYLTAEDRVDHVVVPRLTLAGADLDLVLVEPADDDRPVTVERIAAAVADGVRFIVLDPLSLFISDGLPDGDERGDLRVRNAMRPIIALAQRHGVAIVGLKHVNKTEGRAILNRAGGSRAYTAAARALLFIADDPDSADPLNPDRLIFPRGNLATVTSALRYRIDGASLLLHDGELRTHPRIVWKGESTRSAEEAFMRSDRGPASERDDSGKDHSPDSAIAIATAWLLDIFTERDTVLAAEVLEMADDEQVSRRTVQRAATELGVTKTREGFGRGSKIWWTHRPDATNTDDNTCIGDSTDAYMTAPSRIAGTKSSMAPMENGDQGVFGDELFAGAVDVTPVDPP